MKGLTRSLVGAALLWGLTVDSQARPSHPNWPPRDYALCYGAWTPESVQRAHQFELVVVHPGENLDNLTPQLVEQLRQGADGVLGTSDDVIVLAYLSVGEDDRPPSGPAPGPLAGPSYFRDKALHQAKNGYPTRFLDQLAYVFEPNGERRYDDLGKPETRPGQDGLPDENGVWGSYYVHPGDPEWQQSVLSRLSRLERELKVDGFFLDTLDTASPWGNYGFTGAAMAGLLKKIRARFPQRIILANRGMFLLESQAQAFASSIDGLLYESLYTIWDWSGNQGILSPWLKNDYAYLQKPVLPASQRKPGFHLFFVNYLQPEQSDFYPMLHAIEDLVGREGISNYVSDPLLQTLKSPWRQVLPRTQNAGVLDLDEVPQLQDLTIKELPLGRFEVNYQLAGLGQRQMGRDLFLDLRISSRPVAAGEIPLLEPIKVDYLAGQSIQGLGLEKASSYNLYLRVVGKTRACRSEFQPLSLVTLGGPQTSQVQALKLRLGLSELHWKPPAQGQASGYRVYWGSSPRELTQVAQTSETRCRLDWAHQNQPVYVSVTALTAQGQESALCKPLKVQLQDSQPPTSPSDLRFEAQGSSIRLSWNEVADASGYRVYLVRKGEPYRVPFRLGAGLCQFSLGSLAKGLYQCWVTSVDSSGNESRRNQIVDISIK